MKQDDKEVKITRLLKDRQKTLAKLRHIDEIFKEEKENEDAWPGHDTIGYCHANIEGQVLQQHLNSIDRELLALGYSARLLIQQNQKKN
ncbi:MAG: hypothetical protein ABID04_03615 [Patescibacteria group bacterium]